MSDKTKLLLGFGFMLIVLVFAIITFRNHKNDVELLHKRGVNTVGVFVNIIDMKGTYRLYEFYANGEKIITSGIGKFPGEDTLGHINQMYEVRYLASKPTISQMNYLKPINELEQYGIETKGQIDVIHWIPSEKHWLVRYSYDKNGKKIKSKQAYRYWDTSNVKAGRRIKVKYSSFREGKDLPEKSWIIPGKEPAE